MNLTSSSSSRSSSPPPIANEINFYFSIGTIPLGITLNMITIVIFWTDKKISKEAGGAKSMRLLYIALSAYDILALLNSLLFTQFLPSLNIDFTNYSPTLCKALNIWRKTAIQCPSWVQVLITFDRLRSVVFPNRIKFMCKNYVLVIVLAVMTLLLCLANVEYLWFSLSSMESPTTSNQTARLSCGPSSKSIVTIADISNVLLRFLLPFSLMLVMNIVLVRSLFVSKRKTASNKSRSMRREINYTLTVIGLNLIFLTLNLPWTAWYVLSQLGMSLPSLQTSSSQYSQAIFKSIAFSILYLDNLSVFFLNFMFNRNFRRHTMYLLTRLLRTNSSTSFTASVSRSANNSFKQ